MNRRDLLDPRHAAHLAGQALAALDDALPGPDEYALIRLGWRAMATGWQILLPLGSEAHLPEARQAFELLDELEDQLTVYRDHSEVSRLNQLAASHAVEVEPRLFDLLRLASRLSRDTEGAFDVFTGALIKAWGFFRGPRRVPPADELDAVSKRVGARFVLLDEARQTVQFLQPGVEINLGAIGKGYALDRMVESLSKIPAALLHGGSSSVYAKGDPHGGERGWRVRLRHPWIRGRTLADVWLRDRALGTSAATFQYLEYEGRKLGHVLDPRNGWPATGTATASVVAPTAALADALSTAFYVAGVEFARRYCEQHPTIGAVLLPEGTADPVVINLSPGEYTLHTRTR